MHCFIRGILLSIALLFRLLPAATYEGSSNVLENTRLTFYPQKATLAQAVEKCKNKDGNIVLVNTNEVKSTLVSLILVNKASIDATWNESVWAKALTRNKSNNASGIEVFKTFFLSVEPGEIKNEKKDNSSVSTKWHNASLHEQHSFVCEQDLQSCDQNSSCDGDVGTKVSRFGFDVCLCKYGLKQGSYATCREENDYPTSCLNKTINGYNFPMTFVDEIANSIGLCENDTVSATATIRCSKSGRDPFFDLESFGDYGCNETVLDVKIGSDDVELDTIRNVSRAMQALTTRDPNLDDAKVLHTATIISNISRIISDQKLNISEYIYAEIVQTVSNLGTTNLTNTSQINLFKATESLLDFVSFRGNETSATFITQNVFAQILTIDFSDEERELKLPNVNNTGIVPLLKANFSLKGIADQLADADDKNRKKRSSHEDSEEAEQSITPVKFIVFNTNFLPYKDGNATPIVLIEIGNLSRVSLATPMTLDFNLKDNIYGRRVGRYPEENNVVGKVAFLNKRCAYYDFASHEWLNDGLCIDLTSRNHPICLSNHLTSFSLLVSIHDVPSDVALNLASQIGCVITLLSLLASICFYLSHVKTRSRVSSQIQIHMFCNMFLAYFIFFTGIEQVSNVVACSVITITLHYAFLVSFLWMGIYSNRLYNSLLKVFKQSSDNYIWKASLFAYGIPALIISVNVILAMSYLDQTITTNLCDNSDGIRKPSMYFRENMCWINAPSLYFSFLLVVGIVLVYNIFVVCLVAKKVVFKKNKIRSTAHQKSLLKQVSIVTSLSLSLGISWVIGYFLLIDPDELYQKILGWIFAILTSLQGVVLFYLSCFKNQEMFNFWYQPLRKCFCFPKSSRISDDNISIDYSNGGPSRWISLETETTFL